MSESPGGLVKTQKAEPHPRVSDLEDLGCGLGICISDKFPEDIDAAGPGTTL